MAPNRAGGPLTATPGRRRSKRLESSHEGGGTAASGGRKHNPQSVISKEEIESRGSGTDEDRDTYEATLRGEKRVLFTAVIFLTRLPVPRWCEADHHPAYLMRSLQWFPLLGLGIGAWVVLWLEAARILWSPGVAVAVSTMAGVWLTGAFHEDGLADTFDAFGGGWGRAQILRILKDTRVGTYALVGMVLVLAMKLRTLEHLLVVEPAARTIVVPFTEGAWTLPLSSASVALLVAHAVSRWTSLPLIYFCTYIQDEEDSKRHLYNWFADSKRLLTLPRILLATASAVLVPCWLLPQQQQGQVALVLGTVVATTLLAAQYGRFVLGGVVGDFLGATIQVTEVLVYLVLTADWDAAREHYAPFAILAACAALPVLNSRPIVDYSSKLPANCLHSC